jgi:hypothetical protein
MYPGENLCVVICIIFLLFPDLLRYRAGTTSVWDLPRVQVEAFILPFHFISVLCALLHVDLESVQSAPKAALSLSSA